MWINRTTDSNYHDNLGLLIVKEQHLTQMLQHLVLCILAWTDAENIYFVYWKDLLKIDSLIWITKSPHFTLNAVLFLLFNCCILLKFVLISHTMKVQTKEIKDFLKCYHSWKLRQLNCIHVMWSRCLRGLKELYPPSLSFSSSAWVSPGHINHTQSGLYPKVP